MSVIESFLNGRAALCCGDSWHFLKDQPDNRYDSVVTDPPYALVSISKRLGSANAAPVIDKGSGAYKRAGRGFMGKTWDVGDVAFNAEFWAEVLRVLKPGGHVVAFGGTRTYHRLVVAIEDAGFEIRDCLSWNYGSGFPKSHDVSKGIDKAAGAVRQTISKGEPVKRMIPGADQNKDGWEKTNGREFVPSVTAAATDEAREWEGWGTALKPAMELICLARKPLSEKTVAANVLKWGTGAINIDGCRVLGEFESGWSKSGSKESKNNSMSGKNYDREPKPDNAAGRWPANVLHDGSEEVVTAFPVVGDAHAPNNEGSIRSNQVFGADLKPREFHPGFSDSGSAARFFYTAKADAGDRLGSRHPTVKPVDLMQWLIRLVTPKNGLVLDPFAGTGTTAEAAFREGMRCTMVERETEYQADIRRRMGLVLGGSDERRWASLKAKGDVEEHPGPLFG